jgi:hypothetical protein
MKFGARVGGGVPRAPIPRHAPAQRPAVAQPTADPDPHRRRWREEDASPRRPVRRCLESVRRSGAAPGEVRRPGRALRGRGARLRRHRADEPPTGHAWSVRRKRGPARRALCTARRGGRPARHPQHRRRGRRRGDRAHRARRPAPAARHGARRSAAAGLARRLRQPSRWLGADPNIEADQVGAGGGEAAEFAIMSPSGGAVRGCGRTALSAIQAGIPTLWTDRLKCGSPGPGHLLRSRGEATTEIRLPRPIRSRAWLEEAPFECRRCHRVVERRSPVQRHCTDCRAALKRLRHREAPPLRDVSRVVAHDRVRARLVNSDGQPEGW